MPRRSRRLPAERGQPPGGVWSPEPFPHGQNPLIDARIADSPGTIGARLEMDKLGSGLAARLEEQVGERKTIPNAASLTQWLWRRESGMYRTLCASRAQDRGWVGGRKRQRQRRAVDWRRVVPDRPEDRGIAQRPGRGRAHGPACAIQAVAASHVAPAFKHRWTDRHYVICCITIGG